MGTGRDIKDTIELRESEMPMLKFMTSHAVKIKQDFRDNFKEHIHLQGYDKETHRKRTAAAAMFSKKFCTALCKDILALESKEPGISINKFSRAFPAAADDEAEDEAPLAQLPAPAGPKSLDDLMEEFKDIDTKSIKITLDTFTPTEAQWIKAAILSITDYTMSFGFDETEFSNPDDYKDRIRFLGNKDGHYHMSVVKDWRSAPEDDIDTTTTIYIITLLGKIEINGRVLSRTKPNMELRELPKKLTHANEKDRAGLLRLLHERFWHNSPLGVMKLLQAMLLPQAIVLQGMEICKACEVCQQWAKRHIRPQIKSFLATVFNEMVQHDLFFLWDETFMILIDEATKWKTGDHLINKTGPVLVKALNYLWIRIWGAMQNLLTDQEGGLMGHEATKLCDRLEINRLAIGKGGATTKGLCCAGHNCTLNYGGSTPQLALTGQLPRMIAIDSETITSMTGALEKRPDYMESMSRARLLARQAIVQSVIQDRLAQASKITQHQHEPELLAPGTICDIWREPARKDECGWRGPAEVISLERRAGSAIVKHQGQPLIIPLRHLRRHVLTEHYITELNKKNDMSSFYIHYDLVNPTMVKAAATFLAPYQIYADGVLVPSETLYDLMDLVDGSTPTKIYWFGLVWQQEQYRYVPSEEACDSCKPLALGIKIFSDTFKPYVDFLRLNMHSGLYCYAGDERTERTTVFVYDQSTNYSTMMLYSYDHCEDLDKHFDPPELDWSGISMIDWPVTTTTTDDFYGEISTRSLFIVNGLTSGYAGYVLDTGNEVIVLVMTVHVDDLQITGSRFYRDWIHKKLELFNVVSLQTKLQSPTIKDLLAINAVIKRLKKNPEKFGIYYRKLKDLTDARKMAASLPSWEAPTFRGSADAAAAKAAGHARPQTLEARGRLWRGPFGLELAVLALARRSCRGVPPPAPPRRLRDGGLRGLARFRGRGPASKGVGGWTGEAPARREVRLAAQAAADKVRRLREEEERERVLQQARREAKEKDALMDSMRRDQEAAMEAIRQSQAAAAPTEELERLRRENRLLSERLHAADELNQTRAVSRGPVPAAASSEAGVDELREEVRRLRESKLSIEE
ncbi:unnamed protein product, partial [Prorocentrum cordatum]